MLVKTQANLEAGFAAALGRLGFDAREGRLGLAVSGGGDSMAMLHLAHSLGLKVQVASVDHGLRTESADEAQYVADVCAAMGYDHQTLRWQGWDGKGNILDRARRARRALLAGWAQKNGLQAVALAHSQDDLAETFLMRLARGAGVDGLAAMRPRFAADGANFLRPLLWATRGDLRSYLRGLGATWVDDPSNIQDKYDRVRARLALPQLQKLGIDADVLAAVAQHMADARAALDFACDDLARAVLIRPDLAQSGIITLAPGWQAAPSELQRRLFQRMIQWLAPTDYPPRGSALSAAMARIAQNLPAQLGGCHFLPHNGATAIFREARRAAAPCAASEIWDGVWRVSAPHAPHGAELRPLGGAGLQQWPMWRRAGLPRAALLSQPSLWAQDHLIATPLMSETGQEISFLHLPAANSLYSMRLSH